MRHLECTATTDPLWTGSLVAETLMRVVVQTDSSWEAYRTYSESVMLDRGLGLIQFCMAFAGENVSYGQVESVR